MSASGFFALKLMDCYNRVHAELLSQPPSTLFFYYYDKTKKKITQRNTFDHVIFTITEVYVYTGRVLLTDIN